MLNINMKCSRSYAQHFQLYFHVFQSFMLNTNNLIDHVLQGPRPTQKISLIMCFMVHAQHKTYTYIYIINNWLMPNIQRKSSCSPNTKHIYTYIINNSLTRNIQSKSSCSYAVGSLTQYIKINHQDNIIINRLVPISIRSKIQDITSL